MKAKNIILIASILFIGSLFNDLSAQQNLEALVKKCETMESVSMTVIRNKDSDKKVAQIITSIDIKSDPQLVNEFIEAFKKDEPNSTQSIDGKDGSRIVPQYYSFGNVSYSFSSKNGEKASISVIDNDPK